MLDPFCGSGATAEAALRCGRAYFGSDSDPEAVEATNERIKTVAAALQEGKYPDERTLSQVMDLYVRKAFVHASNEVR